MARGWNYTLKSGRALRNAVHAEDYTKILDCMKDCFIEIHNQFPEKYKEYELEDDLDSIENQRDNLLNYTDYDMTFEDVEDEIDYILNDLCDICDNFRIWIEN